jgi:hypothetical protein
MSTEGTRVCAREEEKIELTELLEKVVDEPRYHEPTRAQGEREGPDRFRTCACGEPAGIVTPDGRAYCGPCWRAKEAE